MLQSAHMGPVTSLPPPGADWKSAGGREGGPVRKRISSARAATFHWFSEPRSTMSPPIGHSWGRAAL